MAEFEVDERVDITDVVCPMTFVKAKVAMEELEIGQVLAVTMNDGEPVQNVPRSFKEEGQQVLKLIDNERRQDMAKRVNAEEFEAEVLKASLPVIVEFYSDSCIPCKQLSPVLGGIEDDYEDKLIVVKVNVNFDAELAQKYEVAASPTLLFFKEGKEVNRIRGLVKRKELEEAVDEVL